MSGDSLTTEIATLARVPDMFSQVKTAFEGIRALADVGRAAAATGSAPASTAIIGLGAEANCFYRTLKAIDDDIDAMKRTKDAYERTEQENESHAQLGRVAIDRFDGDGAAREAPPAVCY